MLTPHAGPAPRAPLPPGWPGRTTPSRSSPRSRPAASSRRLLHVSSFLSDARTARPHRCDARLLHARHRAQDRRDCAVRARAPRAPLLLGRPGRTAAATPDSLTIVTALKTGGIAETAIALGPPTRRSPSNKAHQQGHHQHNLILRRREASWRQQRGVRSSSAAAAAASGGGGGSAASTSASSPSPASFTT